MEPNETKLDETAVQSIVNAAHGYTDTMQKISQTNKEFEELKKYIKGDVESIVKRLKKYPVPEELERYVINNDDRVNEFFLNEDGTPMEIVTEDGKALSGKELASVKRNILVYMQQAVIWKHELELALSKFDEERKEIENSMGVTANEIVLNQLELAMERRKEFDTSNKPVPKDVLRSIDHIISGFDFRIEIQTIQEHPSIIRNTLKDFTKDHMIISYGQRYRAAIKKSNSLATLISFISNTPASSFEEIYMPPDKYRKGYENLFLFSIIRYFSMERWTNDTKKMHAMTISLLQQLVNDELPRDIKDKFIDNIGNYLSIFYKELN